MDREATNPITLDDLADAMPGDDRAAAERALEEARRNPVLSAEQACAVAHVHALLAIEERLARLCAALDAPSRTSDRPAAGPAALAVPT